MSAASHATRGRTLAFKASLAAIGFLALAGTTAPTRYAAIVGSGRFNRVPIVSDVVNHRVPYATQTLHIVAVPEAPPNTTVTWSSPDGKNDFGFGSFGQTVGAPGPLVSDLKSSIAVYRHAGARGPAIIAADIGAPLNMRVTYYVRDEVGIGFGCYGFIANGESVQIKDGVPVVSSLADADVATVGPGDSRMPNSPGPGYNCWGENYDPKATTVRLVFKYGGRIGLKNAPYRFLKELPYQAVSEAGVLDVIASDGTVYRLFLSGGAGAYFDGWLEPTDENPKP